MTEIKLVADHIGDRDHISDRDHIDDRDQISDRDHIGDGYLNCDRAHNSITP